MTRVFHAVLLFLHFDFGGTANLDHGHAAGQLGAALFELLAVIVRRGGFDLCVDGVHAVLDRCGITRTIDDGGVVLVDRDALGFTEHVQRDVLELDAEIFADHFAVRQNGDILQHGLAAIAEARCLDGCNLQAAAQLVHDERGQSLTLDIFRDDQQRTPGLYHGFQNGKHRLQVGQLLLEDQDVRIVELDRHLLTVGDEVWREIAAIELHAFDDIDLELESLGFFHGDRRVMTNLVHGFGQLLADFLVAIG